MHGCPPLTRGRTRHRATARGERRAPRGRRGARRSHTDGAPRGAPPSRPRGQDARPRSLARARIRRHRRSALAHAPPRSAPAAPRRGPVAPRAPRSCSQRPRGAGRRSRRSCSLTACRAREYVPPSRLRAVDGSLKRGGSWPSRGRRSNESYGNAAAATLWCVAQQPSAACNTRFSRGRGPRIVHR